RDVGAGGSGCRRAGRRNGCRHGVDRPANCWRPGSDHGPIRAGTAVFRGRTGCPGAVTGFPLDRSFRPRRWLRGPHFQTMLPNWPWRRRRVEQRAAPLLAASEELLLDCGEGVKLQAFHSSPAKRGRDPGKRVAVLLHGWEGSADSQYLLSLAQTLFDENLEVVRLNLRDHGATHHLNHDLFHSCRLPEVVGAVRALAVKFAHSPLVLGGFSLGGNFMLRVAADPEARHLPIERVIAVSPVLDPAVTMGTLEQ